MIKALTVCVILAFASALPARASTEPGFAPSIDAGGTPFSLHASALLRYKVVFKVYNIALYLGSGVSPEAVFNDVPKRLEVEYLRNLSRDMIIEAGNVALEASVPADELARLKERLDRINALYEDVKAGDRYAITYIPGQGTELSLNGRTKGIIEGADFAAAYFKIWLGENAPRQDIRDALLKRGV